MLLRTMSPAEMEAKVEGYMKEYVYSRELKNALKAAEPRRKNFRVPAGYFRRMRHEFKDGTVMHVLLSKDYFRTDNGNRKAEITFSCFFEVMEPKSGKIGYIMSSVERGENVLFTHHCCSRMMERAGKDFFTIMEESFATIVSHKAGDSWEMILGDNRYHAFGYVEGTLMTVTTFVTNDMLFENQKAVADEMKKEFMEYRKEEHAA